MKINELIVEQQLDELGIAQGIGKAVGATAKGIGAVAGGVRGAWDAAKAGYQAGRTAVGGKNSPQPSGAGSSTLGVQAPQTTGGTPGATVNPAAGQAPQLTPQQAQQQQQQIAQQAKVGVGQINKIIPTLRSRDLDSIKKQIDLRQQALKKTNPTGAQQPTGAQTVTGTQPTVGQPNLQVQQGGLTGQQQATAESKEFYSKFLGRDL